MSYNKTNHVKKYHMHSISMNEDEVRRNTEISELSKACLMSAKNCLHLSLEFYYQLVLRSARS